MGPYSLYYNVNKLLITSLIRLIKLVKAYIINYKYAFLINNQSINIACK
jgi:hypothetical protein